MRPLARLLLLVGTVSFVACGGGGREGDCNDGDVQPCYSGPDGTAGVGACKKGTQTCSGGSWGACAGEVVPKAEVCDQIDDDCDGTIDNGVQNACGGCATLDHAPGDACEGCGTYACDGTEAVACAPPTPAVGSTCTGANGCEGALACGDDGTVSCVAPDKNACGGCGALDHQPGEACDDCGTWACADGDLACVPPDPAPGATCTGDDGCAGAMACNSDGTVTCAAPAKNACGVCGGPEVDGVGGACTGDDGCAGALACDTDGTATACVAPAKNDCGVCGADDVAGLGTACTGDDGCAGVLACDEAGTGPVCNAPAKNECGVCGGPAVTGLATACTATNGCTGTLGCNAAGDGAVCVVQNANNCGACNQPDVPNLGDACTDASTGCAGTLVCDANGTGSVCSGPKNNCGVCGATVPGVGDACTGDNGCDGTKACNQTGDGTVCTTSVDKNECGLCGGPAVTGLGDACTADNGCAGTLACNTTGDGTVCDAPASCAASCAASPDKGAVCAATNGCRGVNVCSDTGDMVCETADACAPHLVISQVGTATTTVSTGGNYKFIELYNPSATDLDVSGVSVYYRGATSTSAPTLEYRFPDATSMPAGGFFLVASSQYAGDTTANPVLADATSSGSIVAASGGQLFLVSAGNTPPSTITPTDPMVLDMLGYGSASMHEGTAAGAPAKDGSIIRKASAASTADTMAVGGADELRGDGEDTNDNSADFVVLTTRNPRNSHSPAEP